jgi:pimeloyl-ACP methyl ester carboxylesterase
VLSNLKTIAAALITAGLLLSVTQASAQELSATTVKNVILVHGAFADGSGWAKVIPILQAKGFNVVAVQNPLSSLADDVAATKRAIALQPGPVVLVGHSWAGMVISEAGNDPKVKALVYVSALIPTSGQSAATATKGYPAAPGSSQARPDASGWLWLTRQGVDEDFVPGLPAAERALVYATQGPWNSKALSETVVHPAWMQKPSWEIVDTNDRMIPPAYERDMAKRIHAKTTTLPAGHVPMLSMPQSVANVIADAANHAK